MTEFLQLDLPPLLAAILAGGTCGLLGSFLVLRRESLLGDALSHAVLPGIVVGFALTGLRSAGPMLLGALVAALLATLAIGWVRRAARLEGGAATGLVFTGFFALGLVLLELTGARSADLDVDCVLFGQLETLVWLEAQGWASFFDPAALAGMPRQLGLLAAVALVAGLAVALFWRPLQLIAFDPAFAASLGLRVGRWEMGLNLLIAAAAVAAFESVGSILVVAMLVCPAVALRLMTDRYAMQVLGGAALGAGLGAAGVLLAGPLPAALGLAVSLNAAGLIGTLAGLVVAGCLVARSRMA
ncbi:metal ABC transporter permease [Roseococcus sp. SDR]|uniref:metal ABC transporter permease n=1 Tax=Roseococcus sp. SDR TaxID=2835532 RepID=UPI001BCDB9D9|nr:metal ABC transporter permease [Roseococcus sp. SDR]MBS7790218.1 metal ABC transporter permease [Roseococcus sp. SDR]MBV1845532.1 metal ABC transporter permease [Roseococcus sp. SDR]